jgi:hypothetical protein
LESLLKSLVLLIALLGTACVSGGSLPRPEQEPALRRLIIMVDGVPHGVMDSLWQAGRFRSFGSPSRMISSFPSLTGVAFREIWGEAPTRGYEDRYFDRGQNRVAGGLLDHVFRAEDHAGFHRRVDLKLNNVAAGLAYLVPMTMARQELNGLRRKVAARMVWDSVIVAYFVSTDALAHRTPEDLPKLLLEIEDFVNDVRAVSRPDLEVVLFSDHGNDMLESTRVPIETALEGAGLVMRNRIQGARDVVLPTFGLVGSAAAYVAPGHAANLADVLRTVPGIDLVAFRDSTGRVFAWSATGRAVIESDSAMRWFRYTAVEGDPLQLLPVTERLRATGEIDATGAASDSAWLRETASSPFVDPLRRLTRGLSGVSNPADVIVSLAPGHHFGDARADLFYGVRGTHGSLRTSSSLAFVMTTTVTVPNPIRSDDLQRFVTLPAAEKSPPGRNR